MAMVNKGSIKRVFPGGNTCQGFFSYYDYIIPTDATRIFVIKGGPGVGKSTFMRKIGEAMIDRGYNVEFHHCSSDNGSLDGVVIPAINVALIDGTAPHIVDPKNPGCVDEILHLGDFWNEEGMVACKAQILEYNAEVGRLFNRAYRILKAAKAVYDDWEAVSTEALDQAKANEKARILQEKIFAGQRGRSNAVGGQRKLFASAITPDGPIHYLDTVIGIQPVIYMVKGNPGSGRATLLQKLANTAVERGYDVEQYYCAFDPVKLEHLVIPALGVAVTTSAQPHTYPESKATEIIDMNECLNAGVVNKYTDVMHYNKRMFWELFNKAVSYINAAKKAHDLMETYYVPNMDFTGVAKLWDKTLSRILNYAAHKNGQVAV